MSYKKVAPWLFAASVFIAGSLYNPANAITSVEELRDVNSSAWAYQALSDLVEKYDVIEGYPDYTFKGGHTASRYELAAALNATVKAVGRDLARLGAEKANKSDLATLAKLQEEFRAELNALTARTGALESRATAIEAKNAEQDTRLDLLEKTQIHGDLSLGVLADIANNSSGTGANDGINDSVTGIGRLRLGLKVPVVPNEDNSSIGEGDVIARLVAGFGRITPLSNNSSAANTNPISGYSALAGSASTRNEGLGYGGGTGQGLDARQNVYVESAYFKQHFKGGIPFISDLFPGANDGTRKSSSDLYFGVVPWRVLFNRSAYRGDELNQFQNTALVNNPGLLANNVGLTLAHAWHQVFNDNFSVDLTAAAATINGVDALSGLTVTEELGFNYNTTFLGDKYSKPGSIYFGASHLFFNGNQNLRVLQGAVTNRDGETIDFGSNQANDNVNSFYAGMNQEWWRGIGTSVDWVVNESKPNGALFNSLRTGTGANANLNANGRVIGIQQALTAVASIPLTVFNKNLTKRAKDVIGVGYAYINPQELNDGGTFDDTNEHVFEAFYRYAVNNSVTIVPSAQVILNRAGVSQNDADVVLGLRTNFVF